MLIDAMGKERLANHEVYRQAAEQLGKTFIQRTDLYPQQRADGRYASIKHPLTQPLLVAHLQGKITLGAYLLNEDSFGRFLVFDADDEYEWDQLLNGAKLWHKSGMASYRENSRRGGHLWMFLREPMRGTHIRRFGLKLLTDIGLETVELYPKQGRLKSGPGSLIRLPFGIHRKSGRRYGFVDEWGRPLAPTVREQITLLQNVQTVANGLALRIAGKEEGIEVSADFDRIDAPGDTVSARIKAAISVKAFVSQYVELNSLNTGRCPLHDDEIDSFSVNEHENYWHCFACERGGSIIDFWMLHKNCDFRAAVRQLARLFLA